MKYTITGDGATAQVEAETLEQAAMIADPILRGQLVNLLTPEDTKWPREMEIRDGDGDWVGSYTIDMASH